MKNMRWSQSVKSTILGYCQAGLDLKFWGLLLGAGCLLTLDGCKKEAEAPNEIFGQWQWISDVGGFTGKGVYTPATTKNERTYQFNRDSTFVECVNKQCKAAVTFTSRLERSIFDGQQHLIITIPRKIYLARPDTGYVILKSRYSIVEMGEKLRLAQEVFDGYEESYSRK